MSKNIKFFLVFLLTVLIAGLIYKSYLLYGQVKQNYLTEQNSLQNMPTSSAVRHIIFETEYGPIYEADSTSVYCVGDDFAYFDQEKFEEKKISDFPKTFKVINRKGVPNSDATAWYYSTDEQSVFFKCEKLEGADPKTFEQLTYDFGFGSEPTLYARDNDSVYFRSSKLENADVASFSLNESLKAHVSTFYREHPDFSSYIHYSLTVNPEPGNEYATYKEDITYDAKSQNYRFLKGEEVRGN